MSNEPQGRKVTFPVANSGIAQVGPSTPRQTVGDAGAFPARGHALVTSRNPDDLDSFCSPAIAAFAKV